MSSKQGSTNHYPSVDLSFVIVFGHLVAPNHRTLHDLNVAARPSYVKLVERSGPNCDYGNQKISDQIVPNDPRYVDPWISILSKLPIIRFEILKQFSF